MTQQKVDIQQHLDESHKYMSILINDLIKRLEFLKEQIDERDVNLKDCEEAIKHLPSPQLQLQIRDLKLKFYQSSQMVKEILQVAPKIKFYDFKYNKLIVEIDKYIQNQASDVTLEDNNDMNTFAEKQMDLDALLEADNFSTGSSSYSKNLDLEEIKQNSIILSDKPKKSNNEIASRLPRKNKKGLKMKMKSKVLAKKAAADKDRLERKSVQSVVTTREVSNEKMKETRETKETKDIKETKEDKSTKPKIKIIEPIAFDDKITIRSNTRVCPEPNCKKQFNSVPSVKYHLVSRHPHECHKYRLGDQYMRVASKAIKAIETQSS